MDAQLNPPYPENVPSAGVPDNYLAAAILTCMFCCMPLGVVSVAYAVSVNSAISMGNLQAAQIASKKAKFWMLVTLFSGLAFWVCYMLAIATMTASGVMANLENY